MKKSIILIILSLFIVLASTAQVQRQMDSSQTRMTNTDKKQQKLQMMKDLDLSKEQKGQLKEARRNMQQQKQTIDNDQTLTTEQKQEKLKALRKKQNQQLNTILTPEQKDKLKEERKNKKMQQQPMNATDSTQ